LPNSVLKPALELGSKLFLERYKGKVTSKLQLPCKYVYYLPSFKEKNPKHILRKLIVIDEKFELSFESEFVNIEDSHEHLEISSECNFYYPVLDLIFILFYQIYLRNTTRLKSFHIRHTMIQPPGL
jgi:hypothetical protein